MTEPVLQYYQLGEGVTSFSSTRRGGYGEGRHGEFNINCYCGDSEEAVRRNRAALCSVLGIGDDRLLMPHQVHDTEIAVVDEGLLGLPAEGRRQALDGVDALMTGIPGVCIGVSTADCIPILLYDAVHRAACAVHAGWRGTVKRIAEKAVARMAVVYGTRPSDLSAQIGPGIHLDSFEVGDEVYDAFAAEGFPMEAISQRRAKWHIDLPECNRRQLLAAGISEGRIAVSPVCTFRQVDTFFSARRLGVDSGRIFTGIMISE